jgi:hypothetical protein
LRQDCRAVHSISFRFSLAGSTPEAEWVNAAFFELILSGTMRH